MRLPQLTELPAEKANVEEFLGYNHNLRCGDGEWYDQKNMTTDFYPVASPRKKRSKQMDESNVEFTYDNQDYETEGNLGMVYVDDKLITLQALVNNDTAIGCCFLNNGAIDDVETGDAETYTSTIAYPGATTYGSNYTFSIWSVPSNLVAGHKYKIYASSKNKRSDVYNATCVSINTEHSTTILTMSIGFESEAEHDRFYDTFEYTGAYVSTNRLNFRDVSIANYGTVIEKAAYLNPSTNKYLVRMGSYIFAAPDGVVYESNSSASLPIYKVAQSKDETNVTLRTVIENTSDDDEYTPITVGTSYRYADGNVQSYLEDDALWVNQPTYLFIYKRNSTGSFDQFSEGDALIITKSGTITVSTTAEYKDGIFKNKGNEANCVILKKGTLKSGTNIDNNISADTDYILVSGFVYTTVSTSKYFACSISDVNFLRKMPDIKFACESQNRIWACSKDGHEIYASALGNPYNFYNYSGISTDSYAVNVGTDGQFTGCVNYLGQPLFFKENSLHIIGGSYPTNSGQMDSGSYSVQTMNDFKGCESGSERSFAIINNILYYKSANGIVAFDGATTAIVSDALGKEKYKNAVGGAYGDKYYVSMQDASNNWHMFVYDTSKGVWSREDSLQALQFVKANHNTLYSNASDNKVYSVTDENALNIGSYVSESDFDWMCESGNFGYSYPDNKYLSRFQIRMQLTDKAHAEIYIQYDSSGVWEKKGDFDGKGTKTFLVPIVPVRCDHMKLKIVGKGDAKIFSIAKILEIGGDV